MTKVPFYQHDLGSAELAAIADVFATPILTTGEFVERFERRLAEYLGRRRVVAVSSCTGGLHLVLAAFGIGAGHEVITTPMTFIATATAILQAGARPVFVDVEPDTGNIDADRIEAAITPRTRAIMPVHLYGQMADMHAIRDIARRYQLIVVEDAAHCVEGRRDGVGPAGCSAAAAFSFYATKNIACGEGGAVATDDDDLADRLRLLRLHGMSKNANDRHREGYQHWDMTTFGWKYNLDNIHAAIMLPQLDRLEEKWARRKAIVDRYKELLGGLPFVSLIPERPGVRHAYHLMVARIASELRDSVLESLQRAGIGVMVNYRAIHLLSYFRDLLGHTPGDFPTAETFGDSVVSLAFYPTMPMESVDAVVAALRSAVAARVAG